MRNLVLFFLIFPSFLFAQLNDNTWLLGYQGGNSEFGITEFTFTEGNLKVKKSAHSITVFGDLNTCYSDSIGDLVALFNGYWVGDKKGKKMKGGDSIRYENEPNLFGYSDSDIPQGGMFLPWPDHPDSLLLFYVSQGNAGTPEFVELASLHLQYALIKLSGNNGLGEVTIKRHVVLQDTIQYGRLSACKHANGRDWWVMINKRNSNHWYRYLLDPDGVKLLGQQEIGLPMIDGFGQAVFSPDGRYYAAYNGISITEGAYLDVYDFNRCNGLFENHRQLFFNLGTIAGVAISPNSRYLYLSKETKLFQYDLQAPDLAASELLIGVYDGFISTSYTIFYQAQLAPDAKIYICCLGSTKVMHVIHSPDEAGTACQFEQHGILLPVYNDQSLTSSPYFRLGPLDGSPCDTLGLDNHPKAWYRYQQDSLDFLSVAFHDLSYYEPTDWYWDFGDPGSGASNFSHQRHPQHQFDSAGVYQVCLTVSNVNSSNTHCKTLYLGVSATDDLVLQNLLEVSPNPFRNYLNISLNANLHNPVFRLYDQMGQLKCEEKLAFGIMEIDTEHLPRGMYFWEVQGNGLQLKTGKIIKTGR